MSGKTCPDCGSEYQPVDELGGSCPHCLFDLGVETAGPAGDVSDRRLGPYSVLKKLGEGGMGVVYLAEQQEPIRRRVALKIIKLGMDTRQVIARFEGERQALALMNHRNVARVFDAGVTEQGRPYFVMEYVPGVPITEFCDREKLGISERIELFRATCDAIQHAHQKGIVHRDVKPSNVLVSQDEGDSAQVKVIDFGVAKATSRRLTERTLFTEDGVLLGTPEYMSPEQADPGASDVDTRTDVYSLGVLLYELMAGVLPFDAAELRRAGFEEILRRVREDDPPRPSRRLGTLGAKAATTTARMRSTDTRSLIRQLRGDLDWIVMRALEKSPGRRYSSPSELAADIARFLQDEPVVARPPSTAYRAGKFIRRYRGGVLAGAIVLGGLIAGGAIATWQAVRATRAEAVALDEVRASERVVDFMVELFESADPGKTRGAEITAREIVGRGVEEIGTGLERDPRVRLRLLHVLGRVQRSLGMYDESLELVAEAASMEAELLGGTTPRTLLDHGFALLRAGRYDEAKASLDRALELAERSEPPDERLAATALYRLSWLHNELTEYQEMRAAAERALAIRERILEPDDVDLAFSLRAVAIARQSTGDAEGTLALLERAQTLFEGGFGDDDPIVADNLDSIGITSQQLGRPEEAWSSFERALEVRRRILGPNHPDVAYSLYNMGRHRFRISRQLEAARPLYEECLRIREETLGPDHPTTAMVLEDLGIVLAEVGDPSRAIRLMERALAINEKALGRTNGNTLETAYNLAIISAVVERPEDVIPYLSRAGEGDWLIPGDLEIGIFDPFRGDPEFQRLEAEVRRRSEATQGSQ